MLSRIRKALGVRTQEIRKFKDPVDPGMVLHYLGEDYLVVDQWRRGFFTIYTGIRMKFTGYVFLDAPKMAFLKLIYELGLTLKTDKPDA